jgi:pilus assembly protein Flp/PilA
MEYWMKTLFIRLIRDEKGQDIIEYALLAAAISVVAIPTVPAIGTAVNNAYGNVKTQVQGLPGAGS